MSPSRTQPVLEYVPSSSTPEEVLEVLLRDGGVIVRQLASIDVIDEVCKEITPHIMAGSEWEGGVSWAKESRRVCGLAGKSRTFATKLLMNPLYQAVCDKILTKISTTTYGTQRVSSTFKPQLTNSMAFWVGPGSAAQGLHRDDQCHHTRHPAKYETEVGIMFAGTKATRENGATNLVPGSHKWDDYRKPRRDEVAFAEMEKGDAVIWLGSTYHGAGFNATKDENRLLLAAFLTPGWCRQDENQYLAIPLETILSYPVDVQKILGYYVSRPYGGFVEQTEPLDFLAAKGDLSKITMQDLV